MTSTVYSHLEASRQNAVAIPAHSLPEALSPMDELWSIKAAIDMVSFRPLTLQRYLTSSRGSRPISQCSVYGARWVDMRTHQARMKARTQRTAGRLSTISTWARGMRPRQDFGK